MAEGENARFPFFGHPDRLSYVFCMCQEAHVLKNAKIVNWKKNDEILGIILPYFT